MSSVTPFSSASSPWWARMGFSILDKPGGLAIVFSIVLLAMLMGLIPSTLSSKLDTLQGSQAQIMQQHSDIKRTIEDAISAARADGAMQTKLLRAICIIMAKTNPDQLQYCNP